MNSSGERNMGECCTSTARPSFAHWFKNHEFRRVGSQSKRRGGWRSDLGLTSTEMAIVLPLLLATLLTVFQSAFYWHAWNVANLAAEQGVAAGQIEGAPASDAHQAAAAIISQTGGLSPGASSTVSNGTDAAGGATIQVTVTANPISIIPVSWPITATAEGRMEEFIGADER